MKRQTRPFTVEIKHKRGYRKQARSIWGNLDLSKVASEMVQAPEWAEATKARLVDSDTGPVVVEEFNEPPAEFSMPNNELPDSAQATLPALATEQTEPGKKIPRTRKARTRSVPPARKSGPKMSSRGTVSLATARAGRKVYSEMERTTKLGQIEKSVRNGASTKHAVQEAGISEQTYYQWKRAATTPSNSGDLKDLLALEEENKRLKALLADRLRKENAELKKKLGLK